MNLPSTKSNRVVPEADKNLSVEELRFTRAADQCARKQLGLIWEPTKKGNDPCAFVSPEVLNKICEDNRNWNKVKVVLGALGVSDEDMGEAVKMLKPALGDFQSDQDTWTSISVYLNESTVPNTVGALGFSAWESDVPAKHSAKKTESAKAGELV